MRWRSAGGRTALPSPSFRSPLLATDPSVENCWAEAGPPIFYSPISILDRLTEITYTLWREKATQSIRKRGPYVGMDARAGGRGGAAIAQDEHLSWHREWTDPCDASDWIARAPGAAPVGGAATGGDSP